MNVLLIILALGFLILDAGLGYKLYVKQRDNVIPHVTIETGSEVTLDLFLKEDLIGSGFITDVSQIDTTVPASYALKVKTFGITRDVVLDIVDTTAPSAEAVPQFVFQDDVPEASETVTNVYDLASVSISYAEEITAPLEGGAYDVAVRLTDAYGNETVVNVPFEVTADVTSPELTVPECIYAYVGGSTSYMDHLYCYGCTRQQHIEDGGSHSREYARGFPREKRSLWHGCRCPV